MIVKEFQNPFDLSEGHTAHQVAGCTLLAWMQARYRGSLKYVSCVVLGGQALPADEWDRDYGDVEIYVLVAPGDVWTIISVTMSILSVANAILNPPPKVNLPEEPSPTYTLGAQRNAARIGAGVPVHYGKVRVWPDLAAQPYTVYQGNDQYLFQLFCIGLGQFDFEALKIDDTDVSAYPEIEYAYYFDEAVTLFPTNVETSVEPAGQTVTYNPTYVGPYIANQAGTQANRLEVDIVFPSGLFRVRGNGEIGDALSSVYGEYREIDDAGDPVGSWTAFISGNIRDNRNGPKRLTFGVDVDPGRYEIRLTTGSVYEDGPSVYTTATWEGMRAYLVDDALVYSGVTVLAVKAKATDNLNSESQRRFNMVATGKKPVWNGSSWSAPAATQAIAWALADIARNENLGNQADANLDIASLAALNTIWEHRGDTFNFRFDTAVTLWEALKLAAKAGRAYPILNADQVSFVRSSAQSVPVTLFNRTNMVKGSFSVEYAFKNEESFDAVIAEYYDPARGWVKSQVLCQPNGSAAATPRTVFYPGIIDRAQAFREGIFDATVERLQTKVCRFVTELEGYIPNRGDLVKIAQEDFDMWQGGEVVAVTGSPAVTLTLSEPVDWTDSSPQPVYTAFFRQDNGDVSGPHIIERGANDFEVVLASALSFTPYTDGSQERTKYVLGTIATTEANWVITEIKPKGGNLVQIVAVNDVAAAHTADQATIPDDLDPNPLLITGGAPIVTGLYVSNTASPEFVVAAWAPAPGALEYVVERKINESPERWVQIATTKNNFLRFPAPVQKNITVRVAGIGSVRGPFATWTGDVNSYTLNAPTGLTLAAALSLTSSGEYETVISFSFTPPASDYHVFVFEAQYKFPRHDDWQPLFYSKESAFEFSTVELGTIQVRVRTIYVPEEEASDWSEASISSVGTYTAVASIGLAAPTDPKLYITLGEETAFIRVETAYDTVTSPQTARPDTFVIFYSVDDVPNRIRLGTDRGDKLNLNAVNIEGTFQLSVVSGSTADTVAFADPQDLVDADLSGMWWVRILRTSTSPNQSTPYHKITQVEEGRFYVNPIDPFEFTPAAGDTLEIIEASYHDSRLPEFSLLYVDGEVIKHEGIDFDDDAGVYIVKVASGGRGNEGTTQATQSGKWADYFPAFGADTKIIPIPFTEFRNDSGILKYAGDIPLLLPKAFNWAAVTCCFIRKATAAENTKYVRSNIVPLTIAGKA